MEHHVRIYDDSSGYFVAVRPDRDGLDMCEISYNDGDQAVKDERTIAMPWAMARLLAEAIINTQPIETK